MGEYLHMKKGSNHRHHKRKRCQTQGERPNETPNVSPLASTDILRDYDGARVGKAHGDKGQEVVQIAADGHSGKPGLAYDVSDDHHIHHVIDHLQHIPEKKRGGKLDEAARDVTRSEIVHQNLTG